MSRFHAAAKRIQSETGVRCEYAPANGEYVVDYTMAGSSAAKARQMAMRIKRGQQRSERAALEAQSQA